MEREMRVPQTYQNRRAAGQVLATSLSHYAKRSDVLVFGLSRGGIPVAYEVAKALGAPLDVLVVRKIGVPGQEELAMGAIAPDGISVSNSSIIGMLGLSRVMFEAAEAVERKVLERRLALYRGSRPYPPLEQKTVLLVDDGLATGSTMRAAVLWARARNPAAIVVAAPVASRSACAELEAEKDHLICICRTCPADFSAVGIWYHDFSQVSDAEVLELLRLARNEEMQQRGQEAVPA
jgi:putative phosphoribosyl transferase